MSYFYISCDLMVPETALPIQGYGAEWGHDELYSWIIKKTEAMFWSKADNSCT